MKNILVAGASGYVGSRLVPRLLDRGYHVRCLARNPDVLNDRGWSNAEVVYGNTLEPESLVHAMKNVNTAFYLIHAMGGSNNFRATDQQSARNFAEAAKKTGLERIIYLGGLSSDSETLSEHLRSRHEVGAILKKSGIPVTELRASIIIGSGSASFTIIKDLAKKLPVMITPRWVNSKCQPIAIRDVMQYLIGALEHPETGGDIFDIGGDEILTYREMIEEVANVLKRKIFIIDVPVLTPHLSAYWLNLVTSVPMNIAFPLVEGLRNDTICRDHRIDALLTFEKTPFREAVQRAMTHEEQKNVESSWTGAASGVAIPPIRLSERILSDTRMIACQSSCTDIFNRIQRIGGENGWYYANWAWQLRGIVDRVFGGVGMRRGRRHPIDIRVGDALDFWRVEQYKPGAMLRLRAEMKVPGTAWLEFRVDKKNDDSCVFRQTAQFKPSGWFGYLYWYMLAPAHFLIFRNMARKIVQCARINLS